jgi:hypothetical protein
MVIPSPTTGVVHTDISTSTHAVVKTGRCNGVAALIECPKLTIMAAQEISSGELKLWWSTDGFVTKTLCTFDVPITGVTKIGICKGLY